MKRRLERKDKNFARKDDQRYLEEERFRNGSQQGFKDRQFGGCFDLIRFKSKIWTVIDRA